ncbi:GSCOCG00001658001-RA-CDS, partial [Cotesia congregata]
RKPRFISFNSDKGKIDIDLDLSIPFLSIPLNHEEGADGPQPLVNVNLKSVAIAGVLAGVSAFILPLFFYKPSAEHRYREFDLIYTFTGRNDEFGFKEVGQAFNELMLGNNYVTPCLQYAVCSAVAKVNHARVLSNSDKIIDGIANLGWFKNATHGTAIQEAIDIGRRSNPGCSYLFKGCKMPADTLETMLNELGVY